MHRVSYFSLLVTILLTACSSPYRDPNFPDDFPSSPSVIVEENGWKSLIIIPQRDKEGKEITFSNPNKRDASERWRSGTVIVPVENGRDELILLTDHQLVKEFDDSVIEKYTWIDRVDTAGKVLRSEKLGRYINLSENVACSWGIKNDSSIYSLSPEGLLYQDETLIASYEPLKTIPFDCPDIKIASDKSILVNGRYYFNWQKQSWQDVKPPEVDESNYHITSFENSSSLFGSGVELVSDNQNLKVLRFRVVHQEYDIATAKLITTYISEIEPETDLFNSKDFFRVAEDSEKIYIAAHDIYYSVMGFYIVDKTTNTLEAKAENIVFPKERRTDQGKLIMTSNGDVFVDLYSKTYFLDSGLKFVDITPKTVDKRAMIYSVFVYDQRLYIGLTHAFIISTEDSVKVSQLAFYEPPN